MLIHTGHVIQLTFLPTSDAEFLAL